MQGLLAVGEGRHQEADVERKVRQAGGEPATGGMGERESAAVAVDHLDSQRHLAQRGLMRRAFHQSVVGAGGQIVEKREADVGGDHPSGRILGIQCLQIPDSAHHGGDEDDEEHQCIEGNADDELVEEQCRPALEEAGLDDVIPDQMAADDFAWIDPLVRHFFWFPMRKMRQRPHRVR